MTGDVGDGWLPGVCWLRCWFWSGRSTALKTMTERALDENIATAAKLTEVLACVTKKIVQARNGETETQDTTQRESKRQKKMRSTPNPIEIVAAAACKLSPEKGRAIAEVVSLLVQGYTPDACVCMLQADTALGDRDCRLLEAVLNQLSDLETPDEEDDEEDDEKAQTEIKNPPYLDGYEIELSSEDRDLMTRCAKDLRALEKVTPCDDDMAVFSKRQRHLGDLLAEVFNSIRFKIIEPVLNMYTEKIKEAATNADSDDEDDNEDEDDSE